MDSIHSRTPASIHWPRPNSKQAANPIPSCPSIRNSVSLSLGLSISNGSSDFASIFFLILGIAKYRGLRRNVRNKIKILKKRKNYDKRVGCQSAFGMLFIFFSPSILKIVL